MTVYGTGNSTCIMAIPSVDHFNYLYRTYYPALCFYALKIVNDQESAKDIVEEVFTKLITVKQEFTEADNVRAWLYMATRNSSFDYLRQDKHAKERQYEFSRNRQPEEPHYDYELIRTEMLSKILQEVKQLPGNSGKIIEMSFLKGMKNEQIALELGLSEKTVRNLKSSGLLALKSRVPSNLFLSFLLAVSSSGPASVYFS